MEKSVNRYKRPLVCLVVAAVLGGGLLPASTAVAQDSAAVAINTKDGFEIFRLAFKIQRTMKDVVDNANAAAAFSACADCQTVAIAIQAILIFSDPVEVTTQNLALAINYECSGCETLASAYQFVFTTGGPVRFTAEGNRRIAEIRRQLLELRDSDLSILEIQARVDQLMVELRDVFATELVPAGEAEAEPEPQASPSPSASPTGSPSPDVQPSPSPSPTTSPETSPSPSPSP